MADDAANSMSPVIKPQDQLGPAEANHGCYQASVEQCPPEGFWNSTFHEPINLFTFVLAIATVLLGVSTALLWLSTRRLARDAERSAKQELRAYVGPNTVAIRTGPAPNMYYAAINLRNSGSTPASDVRVALSIRKGEDARDFAFALGIIDPSADAHHTAYFDDEWITALDIPNVRVELTINYVDAFGRSWERTGKYTPLSYVPDVLEVSFHFSVKDGSSRETEKR